MAYACGNDFSLQGAKLKVEVVNYTSGNSRLQVERNFVTIYDAPFQITGEDANGYKKKVVADIEVPSYPAAADSFLAFRVTIYADVDAANGVVPYMKDLYLEGFSILEKVELVRKEPPKCVIF